MRFVAFLAAMGALLVTAFAGNSGVAQGSGSGSSNTGSTISMDGLAAGQDGHTYGTLNINEGSSAYAALYNPTLSISTTGITGFKDGPGDGGIGGAYTMYTKSAQQYANIDSDVFFNGRFAHMNVKIFDNTLSHDIVFIEVRGLFGELLYQRLVFLPKTAFRVILK